MIAHFLPRTLPPGLDSLTDLALDLRWTWSHAGDALWRNVDKELWERTRSPWAILQNSPRSTLERLDRDASFRSELQHLVDERTGYLSHAGGCAQVAKDAGIASIAYFSMEFGLSEAFPLYAGGLGILAGDYLKTSSDLGVPVVGIGLLYQEGYFRQVVDAGGHQLEAYPYNNPTDLPIQPVFAPGGEWLRVRLAFPGRTVHFRVWQANIGRVRLYLLDSNDLLNGPGDRGITSKLYGGGREIRLTQEIALGIGGWALLESLGVEASVCHLNEGHAAFAVLERARRFGAKAGITFAEALWATRAGNVFTTHTPVAAGLDTFSPDLVSQYFRDYRVALDISEDEFLALGRQHAGDAREPFNMAYLALRGCAQASGVSRLHAEVSRRLFSALFAGWPETEVPVGHVTNGIHVPSWDSRWADDLWTRACGKGLPSCSGASSCAMRVSAWPGSSVSGAWRQTGFRKPRRSSTRTC
jgi:starch phosphorylase